MKALNLKVNPEVKKVFKKYPDTVREKMDNLRELIIKTAEETEGVDNLEETLKWGEPSYLSTHGSTLRIDWKEGKPDQYAMYFQCTSKLIPTFRTVYKDVFSFEGNRALVLKMDGNLPESELKECIKVALRYHKVKNQLLLGL